MKAYAPVTDATFVNDIESILDALRHRLIIMSEVIADQTFDNVWLVIQQVVRNPNHSPRIQSCGANDIIK